MAPISRYLYCTEDKWEQRRQIMSHDEPCRQLIKTVYEREIGSVTLGEGDNEREIVREIVECDLG